MNSRTEQNRLLDLQQEISIGGIINLPKNKELVSLQDIQNSSKKFEAKNKTIVSPPKDWNMSHLFPFFYF